MVIQDRILAVGTLLTAKYKGTTYTAEVVLEEAGLRYQLSDGRLFKSPSAAGSAVMGGKACNGWTFWSLASADRKTAVSGADSGAPARQPVPKPQRKAGRGRKTKDAAVSEADPDAFGETGGEPTSAADEGTTTA